MENEDLKPSSVQEPSLWPRRRFARMDAGPPSTDEFGFVLPSDSDLTPQHVVEHRVVLVAAPPWTGKSWVARKIELASPRRNRPFVARTPLETLGPGSPFLPSWWEEWQQSELEALWIVDSVDEDARIGRERYKDLLGEVEHISEAQRERLSILFVCREAEVPERLRERLGEIWNDLQELRLLPLDRESAAELVQHSFPNRDFKEVCETIRTNRLTSIAALPAVLETLAQFETSGALTVAEVWRRVLWDLLRDKGAESPEIDDLFTMATQLAIVASFCRPSALDELSSVPSGQPAFDLLVPRDHNLSSERRIAARQALKTALFTHNARPTRFLQDHTREWLAAFGMQSWQLGQVRPLVTLQDGKLNDRHRGLLGILWQVSQVEAVKRWIVEASGGIVPPSDAAPWSLEQALFALDKVTELARRSAWGMTVWREQLAHFRVPGIQGELQSRLEAETDPLGQGLLLRVAEVVGARGCSARALQLALAPDVPIGVGDAAISFLKQTGSGLAIQELHEWLESQLDADQTSPHSPRLLRAAAGLLLAQRRWGWDRAARAALKWVSTVGDSLDFALRKSDPGPSREEAISFVEWLVGELEQGRLLPSPRKSRFNSRQALEVALSVLASSAAWTNSEGAVLVRLARSETSREYLHLILEAVRTSPASRRAFIEACLTHGLEPRSYFLAPEDLTWLQDDIRRRTVVPEPLWGIYHSLLSLQDSSQPLTVSSRDFMAEREPELLAKLDRRRIEAAKQEEEERRRWSSPEEPTIPLESLVLEALEQEAWGLREQFLRLAQLCFSEHYDFVDVVGDWGQLPQALQARTIDLCRTAFDQLSPTVRAHCDLDEALVLEAETFCFLFDEGLLDLTPDTVEKWLPALFHYADQRAPRVISSAFAAFRTESERALLETLELTLRIAPKDSRFIEIPKECWSAALAGKVLDLVDSAEVGADVKADFYWRCSEWQRDRVLDAARSWVAQDAIPELRRYGLDMLMVHSPGEGLPWLLKLPATEASLERTRWINSEPKEIVGKLGWAELANLYDFLWWASPPKPSDDEEGFRAMGAVEWGGQRFRGAILEAFSAAISEPDALAALADLAARIDWIKDWRDHSLRSREAADLLRRRQDPATGEHGLKVGEVLESIHSSDRRLLRSVGDLHALVVEEIRAIGVDAKQRHLAMLYRPAAKKNEARERLHEDALQAYLHCRLSDRLERRLEKRPTIDYIGREIHAHQNQKIDLGLRATSVAGGALEIVIEVKWNNHREVWTALEDQLGERYLRKGHLTHGIYLVGVCGEWASANRPEGGVPPDAEEHFRSQASKLGGLTIEPIVLDLCWDSNPPSEPPKKAPS